MGFKLSAALWPLWYVRGYAEGRAYLAALLALPDAATVKAPRAESLLGAGQLALWQGDYATAATALKESVALSRSMGNERGTADALLVAGFVSRVREEYDAARVLLEEALKISRSIGHRFITAAALHHLGMMTTDAREGNPAARALLEESLGIYRTLGLPRFIGLVLFSLGDVDRAEGDHVRAQDLFREGLNTMTEIGEKLGIPSALDSFAHLAMDEGQAVRAALLSGAAERLRETSGTSIWPVVRRSRERWLAVARETLGDEAFHAAWAEGLAMTRDQAVIYALGGAAAPTK